MTGTGPKAYTTLGELFLQWAGMEIIMAPDKHQIPDNLDERIRLIENAIRSRCKSLQVKKQEQHIQINGAAGRLTKEEKAALRDLGISHSTYGARLYKEHDEYRDYVKHLIERRLIGPD